MLIHTFATGDLRAGRCVRASRPEVPLGPLMYASYGWQQLSVALGAYASSGRPPTGTFMLSGQVAYLAGTVRAAARSLAAFCQSDSAAV